MKTTINAISPASTKNVKPENWLSNYENMLFSYTRSRISNEEIVKDIVSETLLGALKALPNFRGECSESSFLISILKRKIIDYYRRINSNKFKSQVLIADFSKNWEDDSFENILYYSSNDLPDYIIQGSELENAVNTFILTLNDRYANVFKLHVIEGLTVLAISERLNIERERIWIINHLVRKKLRQYLIRSGLI